MPKCKYYTPYMDTLKKMCKGYYKLDDCGAGGPLHILLDDDNYDIHSIHFCMNECFKSLEIGAEDPLYTYSSEASILGIMICNEYAKMSLEERATFDAFWNDESLECRGNCEDCSVRDELYEHMKEAEGTCDRNERTDNSDSLLVIKVNAFLPRRYNDQLFVDLHEQRKSGTIVLPPFCEATLVPNNCEVLIEKFKEEPHNAN